MYKYEDITFANTQEFRRDALHFLKYGCYTKAIEGTAEYIEYWDEQERRRKEGYSVAGVHITGEHYGYLNFAQIKLTKKQEFDSDELLSKGKKVSGKKIITFPDFYDGDYHYFKAREKALELGLHLCVGKARRKGYSYKNGWIAANKADLYPDSITVLAAFDAKYLFPEGTMGMAKNYLDFICKHTDWNKGRLKNAEDHIKIGYKEKDGIVEHGFKSQIISVSCGPNNPGAARGKDGTLILFEEAGKFPNLLPSLSSTRPTVEDGAFVTGQIIIFGTGGDADSNWEDFEEIFYNPELYNMMPFVNVWDDNASNTNCGFFVPQTMNMPGFIDENGNSLTSKAIQAEKSYRQHIKDNAKSADTLVQHTMEFPLKPSEAFSRSSENIFPTLQLDEQLKRVQNDPNLKYLARNGFPTPTKDGFVFKHSDVNGEDFKPVLNFPLKKNDDVEGCFVEWQPPYRDPVTGKIPQGLYRLWHDPYAQDKDKEKVRIKDSLGSTYVYERANTFTATRGDILVGAYVGRPSSMDAYNQVLYDISMYYGGDVGSLMFENDRGDVKNFFKKRQAYHILADEPDVVWKKELQATKTGRQKGIMMNDKRKSTGAIYLRDWLLTKRSTAPDGTDILNLHYIYDEALLKELLKWNKKGNFDRVSTLIVGMYDYRETDHIEIQQALDDNADDFFSRELF